MCLSSYHVMRAEKANKIKMTTAHKNEKLTIPWWNFNLHLSIEVITFPIVWGSNNHSSSMCPAVIVMCIQSC